MSTERPAGLVAAFLLTSLVSFAQTTGALSGHVTDEAALPLADANVQVLIPDTQFTTATASDGSFRFSGLPTGLYRLRVSHVGFAPTELNEVWVRSGKEERLELKLLTTAVEMTTAEVLVRVPERMSASSSIELTVEKSLRYPATFSDPARLAMSAAGVASTNDQGNHFSVRGNSPSNNAWLLEGAEIVTPNHLTNAGTQSDLPTLTGGGTTILSAQMLGHSRLLTGGLAAPYGNALGGIMDLRLRRGITQRRAYTLQAGLIGIDLGAEGPFKQGGKASYLVNYRYSTLGVLGAMGVALGDEALSFQDLAFTVNLPFSRRTELLLFGMGGNSSNRFDAKDSTEWELDKDSQDIDYEASVGALGLSLQQRIGERSLWKTTVVWSMNDQERSSRSPTFLPSLVISDTAALAETKLSVHSYGMRSLGARIRVTVGVHAVERTVAKRLWDLDERDGGWFMRPYVRYEHDLGQRVQLDVGIGYAHWTMSGSGLAEPRASLRYALSEHGRFLFATGMRGQLPPIQNYAVNYVWWATSSIEPTANVGLGLMRASDMELTYEHRFRPHLRSTIGAFAQHQSEVPVGMYRYGLTNGAGFSIVNEWDGITPLPLASKGKTRTVGGQVGLEHTFFRDLFYQVNATVFDATYVDNINKTYDSRWNTSYAANAVIGREFAKQKEKLKRTWGVNGRFNITGGQRYTPMPSSNGIASEPYSAQYPGTYRLDLRIYLKREREGRTGMWALDLLNATNAQNVAYRYFDYRKGEEVTKYQLGLIPNLSYRIEF
ncbi:MAG: TonB-dependent receptor [Flavobacteriales bacterium]|nr:TonB-dependent receptor [Flavobacteriales bacterium]